MGHSLNGIPSFDLIFFNRRHSSTSFISKKDGKELQPAAAKTI
jgi:hypothetical protein